MLWDMAKSDLDFSLLPAVARSRADRAGGYIRKINQA